MTAKTKAPAYQDEALYRVSLARPIERDGIHYTPAQVNRMKGRLLNTLDAGDILDAEEL